MAKDKIWEAIIVGGGVAGLSAAIYLGRALRDAVIIDSGTSLAAWVPEVQNYLGFPNGISGDKLLKRGRRQARRYGIKRIEDLIEEAAVEEEIFVLRGKKKTYRAGRVLLATGLYRIPPDLPGVKECLDHSMFFCKDCDGYQVQGKKIAITGKNNEAVNYALGMLLYSSAVMLVTNGDKPIWDAQHEAWLHENKIPTSLQPITELEHEGCQIKSIQFADGTRVAVDALFTTRGDVYHNRLAIQLGAEVDPEGQICVDDCMRTSLPGLYAAGCVSPANCQMIIAAGQGAAAAQTINRELFETSLKNHSLRRFREEQLATEETRPTVLEAVPALSGQE